MQNPHEMQKTDQSLSADKRLVNLPVTPSNIFHFPDGLPAFEYVHEFVFLCQPDIMPFFIMQSLKPRDLAFICIDPFLVCPGYSPVIEEADVKALELKRREDAFLFSIVTVRRNMRDITTNLQGPVVVNLRTGIGRQISCSDKNLPVRYRLWDAVLKLQTQDQQQDVPVPEQAPTGRILWPQGPARRMQSAETALEKTM